MRLLWVVTGAAIVAAGVACGASGGEPSSVAHFCDAVRALRQLEWEGEASLAIDSSMSDAEIEARRRKAEQELAAASERRLEVLDRLQALAPTALAGDVEVVVSAERRYIEALKKVGYDPWAAIAEVPVASGELTDAVGRVDAYTRSECNIPYRPIVPAAPPELDPPPVPEVPEVPEVTVAPPR